MQKVPSESPTRNWTAREVQLLRRHADQGVAVIAAMLGRSERSVKNQASRLHVSLRRPGERRGLVIGQPRDESWRVTEREVEEAARRVALLRGLRDAIIARDIMPADLMRQVRTMIRDGRTRPLCPGCTRAPQERNGLCRACYLDAVAAAYVAHDAQQQREQDAQRVVWRERQRRKVQRDGGTWRTRKQREGDDQ